MKKKADLDWKISLFLLILLIGLIVLLIFLLNNPKISEEAKKQTNIEETIVYEYVKEPEICFTISDNCEKFLQDHIEKANNPACAFYDLNLKNITEYLLKSDLNVVIEDSTYDGNFTTYPSYALMHNKFCYDNESVITGSMNPTYNDAYRNNNNLIIIYSTYLAHNYADEFNELNQGINGKGTKVKYPTVILNNRTIIKNYFCPEDDCNQKVLSELRKANNSIYFMTYSFTDDEIGDYLISKKDSLDIKGIFDSQQISNYSEYNKMNTSKMEVILDKNKYKLHHKVFIIDNTTIITGSYNPTANANTRNDENLLIITDENITKQYLIEFNKLFN